MSDRDILTAMLTRADIEWQKDQFHPESNSIFVYADDQMFKKGDHGYTGFFTIFGFTEDGALISVGAYE